MNYRDYSNVNDSVKENYRNARLYQNLDYVKRMRKKFSSPSFFIPFKNILEKLNKFIDLSDPDCNLPNIQHAFQCAEQAEKDGKPDWFVLSVFIHDFGKLLYLFDEDSEGLSLKKQWGIVGDTFIVGCEIPDSIVFPEYNFYAKKEDNKYEDKCGISNMFVSYGHDEYLHQLLEYNENTLPEESKYCIRFHSLYLHHQDRAYDRYMDEKDEKFFDLLKEFNRYDLYTKSEVTYDIEMYGEKYLTLWKKYFKSTGLFL